MAKFIVQWIDEEEVVFGLHISVAYFTFSGFVWKMGSVPPSRFDSKALATGYAMC